MDARFPNIVRRAGPPWLVATLVCLCRQRERQTWLVEVDARIDGADGPVAGLDGWSADFHGRGLCLSGPDGEIVDMDFADGGVRAIDPYFFAARVVSLQRASPEQQLRRWLPTTELVVAAVRQLQQRGLLTPPPAHRFVLDDDVEAAHVELADFVIDADAGAEVPGGAAHVAWLLALLDDRKQLSSVVVDVAAFVGDATLRAIAQSHLGPVDHGSAALLDICAARAIDVDDAADVVRAGFDANAHHPFIACAIARYFVSRGRVVDAVVVARAAAAVEVVAGYVGNPMLDELALLLLEHASVDEGRAVAARGLRGSPSCARTLVDVLLRVDRPWAVALLADADGHIDDDHVAERVADFLAGRCVEPSPRGWSEPSEAQLAVAWRLSS